MFVAPITGLRNLLVNIQEEVRNILLGEEVLVSAVTKAVNIR